MSEGQGGLAGKQDKGAAFLELHRSGTGQEGVVQTGGNGGKATHGAGGDDHARDRCRARGDPRAKVGNRVHRVGERAQFVMGVGADFEREGPFGHGRDR